MNPLNRLFSYLTTHNVLTGLVVIIALVGVYVAATTDLTALGLVKVLDGVAVAYGVAVGLAQIKFTRAAPGEQLLGPLALVVIVVASIGAVDVLTTEVTYEVWIESLDPWVLALGAAKGAYAFNGTSTSP